MGSRKKEPCVVCALLAGADTEGKLARAFVAGESYGYRVADEAAIARSEGRDEVEIMAPFCRTHAKRYRESLFKKLLAVPRVAPKAAPTKRAEGSDR